MPTSLVSCSLLLAMVGKLGCAEPPRPLPPGPTAPGAATTAAATEPSPTQAPPPPPPPPPMRALAGTDAFYIMAFPLTGPAVGPSATVCGGDSACRAVAPDDKGEIRRAFDEESWVVVRAPARHTVSVTSDGKVAAVTFQPQCPSGSQAPPAQVTLYRVAKSVTATSITVAPRPSPCPKAP